MTDRALPAGGGPPRPAAAAARSSRGVVIDPNSESAPTRISWRRASLVPARRSSTCSPPDSRSAEVAEGRPFAEPAAHLLELVPVFPRAVDAEMVQDRRRQVGRRDGGVADEGPVCIGRAEGL